VAQLLHSLFAKCAAYDYRLFCRRTHFISAVLNDGTRNEISARSQSFSCWHVSYRKNKIAYFELSLSSTVRICSVLSGDRESLFCSCLEKMRARAIYAQSLTNCKAMCTFSRSDIIYTLDFMIVMSNILSHMHSAQAICYTILYKICI
jgi:hypothetical protein